MIALLCVLAVLVAFFAGGIVSALIVAVFAVVILLAIGP